MEGAAELRGSALRGPKPQAVKDNVHVIINKIIDACINTGMIVDTKDTGALVFLFIKLNDFL